MSYIRFSVRNLSGVQLNLREKKQNCRGDGVEREEDPDQAPCCSCSKSHMAERPGLLAAGVWMDNSLLTLYDDPDCAVFLKSPPAGTHAQEGK